MKYQHYITISMLTLALVLSGFFVFSDCVSAAETNDPATATAAETITLQAVAGKDRSIEVGKKISFDATKSIVPDTGTILYRWDFGDGSTSSTADEVHTFTRPGTYTVTLTVKSGDETSTGTTKVTVYEDLVFLIGDNSTKLEEIESLKIFTGQQGILLTTIIDNSGQPDYMVTQNLTQNLLSSIERLQQADIIIDWTAGGSGLNALSEFSQQVTAEGKIDFSRKAIVSFTGNSSVISRVAQSAFDVVQPEFIILTDQKGFEKVVEARSSDNVLSNLIAGGQKYTLIGAHSQRSIKDLNFTNFLAVGINTLVNQGTPLNTVALLLMIPIIATIFTVVRQMIGFKILGIFIPSLITLSFLVTGVTHGVALFVILFVVATLVRLGMKRFRLLSLPRMAIVMTAATIAIALVFWASALLGQKGFLTVSIFPIIIIMLTVERFIEIQTDEGLRAAASASLETLIIVVLCYFLISWGQFRTFILSYPEVVLITIPINFILGKWTKLTLLEYFRFKHAIEHD